ncbi:hypothetical protein ACFL59_00085 [Planctomycetota bacterium]
MKEMKPARNLGEFKKAFDSGGRFYNVFSKAGDDVLTSAELAAAAGTFAADSTAILYFEMARQFLPEEEQKKVVGILDEETYERYKKSVPVVCTPATLRESAKTGASAIATGYARSRYGKTSEAEYITMVIQEGEVKKLKRIPLSEKYDLYELFDNAELEGAGVPITAEKGKALPDGTELMVGGVVRDFSVGEDSAKQAGTYLEVQLYAST